MSFYKKVQLGFTKIADKNKNKYLKIDSNIDIQKNKEIIIKKLNKLI